MMSEAMGVDVVVPEEQREEQMPREPWRTPTFGGRVESVLLLIFPSDPMDSTSVSRFATSIPNAITSSGLLCLPKWVTTVSSVFLLWVGEIYFHTATDMIFPNIILILKNPLVNYSKSFKNSLCLFQENVNCLA